MGGSPNTQTGDVFNFTINGTTYTAVTDGISSTLNLTAPAPNNLILQLAAWLDATLPNHNVTSNASTLTFEATNPGVAFTLTAAASSSLNAPGGSVVTRPAAYFEISGTASNSTNAPIIHTYTLTSAGPGCLGSSGGVTGTIEINPITSATFTNSNPAGLDENPLLCDGSGLTTLNFDAPNAIAVSVVATTPSWITAAKVGNDVVVSMNVPNLGLSLPATYPLCD